MNPAVFKTVARCRRLVALGLYAAAACATAAAPPATTPAVWAITTITLERGCFGCADEGLLVLRRDGTVTRTTPGNARQGRPERTAQGRIVPADFDRVARMLVTQGFFAMSDSYEDPTIRDGAWQRVAVNTAPASNSGLPSDPTPGKQVFSREQAGPPALQSIVAAIEAAGLQLRPVP